MYQIYRVILKNYNFFWSIKLKWIMIQISTKTFCTSLSRWRVKFVCTDTPSIIFLNKILWTNLSKNHPSTPIPYALQKIELRQQNLKILKLTPFTYDGTRTRQTKGPPCTIIENYNKVKYRKKLFWGYFSHSKFLLYARWTINAFEYIFFLLIHMYLQ